MRCRGCRHTIDFESGEGAWCDECADGLTQNLPSLFQLGEFTLHSGRKSIYKIDCDALDDASINNIAALAADRMPAFAAVEGVPEGGLRLAKAMERWVRPGGWPLLIVDDVVTTGMSLEEHRAGREAIGFVIVSRGRMPLWVRALFEVDSTWG